MIIVAPLLQNFLWINIIKFRLSIFQNEKGKIYRDRFQVLILTFWIFGILELENQSLTWGN